MSIFNKIILFLKDILSPKKCYFCDREGSYLCNDCFLKSKKYESSCCICGKKSKNFSIHKKCLIDNKLFNGINFNNKKIYIDRIMVMTHYKNNIFKKIIKDFKFYGKKDVGIELGEKLGHYIKDNNFFEDFNSGIVLPVPLHFLKKIKRGFNQSEILAENFARVLDLPYSKRVIIRNRYTRQQSKLNREDRLNNLNNSFKVRRNKIDKIDKEIVFLIDDVATSGTTFNEIAKVLKQNGAKKVIGVCVASH